MTCGFLFLVHPWFRRSTHRGPLVCRCTQWKAHQWSNPIAFPLKHQQKVCKSFLEWMAMLYPSMFAFPFYHCLHDLRLALGLAEPVSRTPWDVVHLHHEERKTQSHKSFWPFLSFSIISCLQTWVTLLGKIVLLLWL